MMTRAAAITIDFHNTLFDCDAWFELEVRQLPAAFLAWREKWTGHATPAAQVEQATNAYRALRISIIERGIELPAEACVAYVLDEVGIVASEAEIATGIATLMRNVRGSAAPTPGARELVEALASEKIPLGVVSSAVYHPFLLDALSDHDLLRFFRNVTTSASTGYYKSRPEIYWSALDQLHAEPAHSLHLGDSLRFDVAGAAQAGMRTAWLDRGGVVPSETDVRPDIVVRSLADAALPIRDLLLNASPQHGA
jgi:FMN phosphatase YigB (HAD superfamily)